jgi:hypothetical protein
MKMALYNYTFALYFLKYNNIYQELSHGYLDKLTQNLGGLNNIPLSFTNFEMTFQKFRGLSGDHFFMKKCKMSFSSKISFMMPKAMIRNVI